MSIEPEEFPILGEFDQIHCLTEGFYLSLSITELYPYALYSVYKKNEIDRLDVLVSL